MSPVIYLPCPWKIYTQKGKILQQKISIMSWGSQAKLVCLFTNQYKKILCKPRTYLTSTPEHYCGCKGLFYVTCHCAEQWSWCSALYFSFSLRMPVSVLSHTDVLHLWLGDLLRPPSPVRMLLAFSTPVLISLGISGKGYVNSSGTREGSSGLVRWNPGKIFSLQTSSWEGWDLSLGKGMVLYLGKTLAGEKESPESPRAFLV